MRGEGFDVELYDINDIDIGVIWTELVKTTPRKLGLNKG
jgi:hypothetical protein